MINLKVKGLTATQAQQEIAGRHLPFAMTQAVNSLAFMIRDAEMKTMQQVFDRPKPQTVRNIRVIKAYSPGRIAKQGYGSTSATVLFDQIYDKQGVEYMEPEVEGGQRGMKPSEKRLGQFYVPGMGAKMDAYGNMQGGQVTQILSRLGRFGDVAGYDMNETPGSRKRRSGGSKGTDYFVITKPRGGLQPGVYMRTQKHGGFTSTAAPRAVRGKTGAFQGGSRGLVQARGVVPVMVFTKAAPVYKARFPFFKVAQDVTDRNFSRLLDEAIDYALKTAR